jgi:quercetin dioxygenase-like cupin family protein
MMDAGIPRHCVRCGDVHLQHRPLYGHWEECVANPTEMPGAAPVAPMALAAYQDGAVVSRILLKRDGGSVTLFAFDEGQSLSEHTAPFDAVAHVLEGEALITIAGVPLTVPAGDMVLMPANQPHAVAARTRFKMLLTMIRPV